MIATRRERNDNFIAWPIVEAGGLFTPCAPAEWAHVVREREELFVATHNRSNEADDDIEAGRVKNFATIDEMLASLNE